MKYFEDNDRPNSIAELKYIYKIFINNDQI